jgi:hypothetical protein
MNIFDKLDKLFFAVPTRWINQFTNDQELTDNQHEKALRMSEAVTVSRIAGLSMFTWTVGFVVIAPLVIASLPATWPIWAVGLVGLVAVGMTEALLTLAINTYLNRHEIAKRWNSQLANATTTNRQIRVGLHIAFDCLVTVLAAVIWAAAAPLGRMGEVIGKLLPDGMKKPLRIMAASVAYSLSGVTAFLKIRLAKRFKKTQPMDVVQGNNGTEQQNVPPKIEWKDCTITKNTELFTPPVDPSLLKEGQFVIKKSNSEMQYILVTAENKADLLTQVQSSENISRYAIVSPNQFFELQGCQELLINRCERFQKKIATGTTTNGVVPLTNDTPSLTAGDVVLFYPKNAYNHSGNETQNAPLDPTRCFFKHVTADNPNKLKLLADNLSNNFECRILRSYTKNEKEKHAFTKLLKDGTLASNPTLGASLFAMLTVPGALWMSIGLAIGVAIGFLTLGPVGAVIGGILATWAVPALLTPLTGYTYYNAKGAAEVVSKKVEKYKSTFSEVIPQLQVEQQPPATTTASTHNASPVEQTAQTANHNGKGHNLTFFSGCLSEIAKIFPSAVPEETVSNPLEHSDPSAVIVQQRDTHTVQ